MAAPDFQNTLYIIGAVASATSGLTWFIGSQFNKQRQLLFRTMSLHNREDDDMFQALTDDIHRIHVRNALRDGDDPPSRQTFPRRRYLTDYESASEHS